MTERERGRENGGSSIAYLHFNRRAGEVLRACGAELSKPEKALR